jgi:hypothetical protein
MFWLILFLLSSITTFGLIFPMLKIAGECSQAEEYQEFKAAYEKRFGKPLDTQSKGDGNVL